MTQEIVTLDYARANGLTRYFTGKPCKRGHIAERFVSCKCCSVCITNNRDESRIRKWLQESKEWEATNPRFLSLKAMSNQR